jgi:hypothetical protein
VFPTNLPLSNICAKTGAEQQLLYIELVVFANKGMLMLIVLYVNYAVFVPIWFKFVLKIKPVSKFRMPNLHQNFGG